MKNRIIAVLLTVCMLVVGTAPLAYAAEDTSKREYYNIGISRTDCYGFNDTVNVDFMIFTPDSSSASRVYIKAEDFSYILGSAYMYSYNQTHKECAFVCKETKHVVRFMLNSPYVSVIYVGDAISYTAPYDALYEDEVTWLPFEFTVKLFHMQAVPTEKSINVISPENNPISVANIAHREVRSLAFDWIDEVGMSANENWLDSGSAKMASRANRLLSFEPSAWGMMLGSLFGSGEEDKEYAELIAKTFIAPSQQELSEIDKEGVDNVVKFVDLLGDIDKSSEVINGNIEDIEELTNKIIDKIPALSKSEAVTNFRKFIGKNNDEMKDFAQGVFKGTKDTIDKNGKSSVAIVKGYLVFVDIMENWMMFLNKSDRAISALEIYSSESKYDESSVFERYADSDNEFVAAIRETAKDTIRNKIDDISKGVMGPFGALLSISGFAWNMISGIGPVKTAIDMVENRRVSDYAIKYQDDCLGMYYNYRNVCLAEGGANEDSLDEMISTLYAYLKFSYIARNAAAASFTDTSKLLNGDKKANAENTADVLNSRNLRVAKYLNAMEKDIFTPADANSYDWDDAVYVESIRKNGTSIEKPTQETVPVDEFAPFPEFDENDYINEEEAIELVKRVINKWSGGLLEEVMGDYMNEIYTYSALGKYTDGEIEAYVVQMYTNSNPDALFFVSAVGTEVWLGAKEASGEYYVYTELDLLHADMGDMLGSIGDLGAQLMDELKKEGQQK